MSLSELYLERGAGFDSSGEKPTRAFDGHGMTVDQVRADPMLPTLGQAHPGYAGVVVGSVNVVEFNGGALATVTYGNPNSFRETPIDETSSTFVSIGADYETNDVKIPVIERRKMTTGEGANFQEKLIWVLDPTVIDYRYPRTIIQYKATLQWSIPPTIQSLLALTDAVQAQNGKLHKFGTKQLMFRPQSIRQETSLWSVVYQWISDPGVPNTIAFDTSAGPNWVLNNSRAYPIDGTGVFTVPPFTRVDVEHNPDATLTPFVSFSPIAVEDDNGWATLPGIV